MELRQANPRKQGDIGEGIAAAWLMQQGYGVWIPFGHSPDCDLLAQKEGKLLRIQVKTSTLFEKNVGRLRRPPAAATGAGMESSSG
jgi:Holliday junction resolvase-like predicted endonuclease